MLKSIALRLLSAVSLAAMALTLAGCPGGSDGPGIVANPPSLKPSPPKAQHLTVEVNGDLLIHSPIYNLALEQGGGSTYDFNPMLGYVKPIVSGADLAVCHVETPMGPGEPHGYPLFNTPAQLAAAIHQTGWDACDTASNHTLDQGQAGVDATITALDAAGVAHTGSWSGPDGPTRPLIIKAKGVKVAWLAYTKMTNGIPLPAPYSVAVATAPRILADARSARQQGAQVVVVNLHAGEEYQSQPSDFQSQLVSQLVASQDITAVVGQHVHVVQPIEKVGGKFVVFGEGNLLSNQSSNCCPVESQDGLIALLHLTVTGKRSIVTSVDYIPTWVRHPDFVVLPVSKALKEGLAPASDLQASWGRTTSVVGNQASAR